MFEWLHIVLGTVFVLCVIEAVAILALFRQIGNIYLVLDQVPELATAPEEVVLAGKPVPAIDVQLSTGESVELGDLVGGGALILFVRERCPTCDEAIRLVGSYLEGRSEKLRVLIVVNDSVDGSRRFAASIPYPCILIADADGHVSAAFHKPAPPYACATDSQRTIRGQGKVTSRAHVEHILSPITGIHRSDQAVVAGDTRLGDPVTPGAGAGGC